MKKNEIQLMFQIIRFSLNKLDEFLIINNYNFLCR